MMTAQNWKLVITCLAINLVVLCTISAAHATPIVSDLSIRSVDIDHNFTGLDVLMFGARNDIGRIVAVVRGPKKNYIVRKKEKILGIWMNSESVRFNGVNNFYALASTNQFKDIKNDNLLSSLGINIDGIRSSDSVYNQSTKEFEQALIQNRRDKDLFANKIQDITFWGETLFRTVLRFPKNIERGLYTAEVYLFDDGLLSSMQSTPIKVSKIGIEAQIFDLAHKHVFIYGILCVLTALTAGWAASSIFGRM